MGLVCVALVGLDAFGLGLVVVAAPVLGAELVGPVTATDGFGLMVDGVVDEPTPAVGGVEVVSDAAGSSCVVCASPLESEAQPSDKAKLRLTRHE
jgi:hypothetical protein